MRLSVTHSTTYSYDEPVFQEPHTFRLRPREDASQRLLHYSLMVSPMPAGKSECLDQDGNVVLEAWFDSPLSQMMVSSSFEIDTLRENPFDFMLSARELNRLPLVYQQPLANALTPYLETSGNSDAVRELARSTAEKTGWSTIPFLTELNFRLFDGFEHIVRDSGDPLAAEETLARRSGSCRDLAVLYCAACRAVGIPARFVSGYEREAAFQEPANMHAWAEVYLAGGGWRGYDPSVGLAVANSHVAIAAAADPRLAAPISGTYRGTARAQMQFQIAMQIHGEPNVPQ